MAAQSKQEYAIMRAAFVASAIFQPAKKIASQVFANITINQLIQQMFVGCFLARKKCLAPKPQIRVSRHPKRVLQTEKNGRAIYGGRSDREYAAMRAAFGASGLRDRFQPANKNRKHGLMQIIR
jgi:hypothetical protein